MDPRSLSRCPPRRDGRGTCRAAWQRALSVAVWLLWAVGVTVGADVEANGNGSPQELRAGTTSCGFCVPAEGARVVDLREAGMDSLGRRMTAVNDSAWDRADRLFQAGAFGDPRSEGARKKTLTHFLLRSRNALHYLAELGGDSLVHRVTESDLARPFGAWYANTTVFPIRFLEQGLVGEGGFCLHYELGSRFDQRVMLGGIPVRVHSDRVQEDDAPDPRAALSVEFSSTIHKTIELLFLSDVCGRVRRETIVDQGDTLELTTVTDLEGMFARRAGTHRLSALVFWRSVTTGERDPTRPRAGACAYFPRISLGLPFFLPDLGLDDLREFDLPNPVVSMEWVRAHPSKPWMTVSSDAFFIPWEAIGPRPVEVDRRFPDL